MGNLGDLSPQGSIAVGVIVGLVSTSLQAIGLTLQRKSHLLEDEKPLYDGRRPPYRRRRWQLGMGMFVISNIVGSTIQITTLPLPVLSTLQASGLVFNTIFATIILGEPFTRYSFAGTVLVCAGAVLIATFGAIGEPAHTLTQLLQLLMRRPFLVWMAMTLIVVGLILVGSKLSRYCFSGLRVKPTSPGLITPHAQRLQLRIKLFRGMCYGAVSGILSAHSLLLAKSAVELLVRTVVDRKNQFNRWQSWVILLGMITLALTQLFYLHRGLKLCSTSVLYPFVFCIYNIIAILDGLIYFRQTSQLDGVRAGLIALGTAILLGGVLCLSWRLEEVDSVAAVTSASATQTGIGPGMAVVEEHDVLSPVLDDQEAHIGEQEPLLRRTPRPRRFSFGQPIRTLEGCDAADLNAASIWAELDDSDDEPAKSRWWSQYDRSRSASGSGALTRSMRGLARHSTIGPVSHQYNQDQQPRLQEARRSGASVHNGLRRSSAPMATLMGTRYRNGGSPTTNLAVGYGTLPDGEAAPALEDELSNPKSGVSSNPLAGPQRIIKGIWRQGCQVLSQWTSPQAGSRELTHHAGTDEDDYGGSSSPLLPRFDAHSPLTGNNTGHRE
ncbi:hypothetical protein N7539_004727 [Penicillium diatomitis]|uniref:Uncharacterized protein n=1 Tax=Penicillium diatomitis TaxID=2819901 RepID=A0A9X0BU27_9EURO|nr:uncharacterized protein N7539_004727 [Penicillium diatomitis]KAJ5484739.1 hypothetical protein N7539_004727 [Penicillium diatomitis]